jgi:hypothetical protein
VSIIMRKALTLLLLAGCTDTRETLVGTQSLEVELVTPANPGNPDAPLADTERTVVVNVRARDATGAIDTTFTKDVQVYAQFLGTLTPSFGSMPLATFTLTNGEAMGQSFTVPNAFGPTVIWIDDGEGVGPAYVHGQITGTSPVLFYRDPFIADLQTPRDEMALDALAATPLQDKQVAVDQSRYGARGRLVVNSVFAQGYTVSDVECADDAGTPPCVAGNYDHAMIFSFSAPRDQCFQPIEVGQVISGFNGGLSEFNGLTELGFPSTFAPTDGLPILEGEDECTHVLHDVNPARLPQPAVVELSWFGPLSDPGGIINFERNEAAPIQINGGTVCDLDEDFDTFKQWKVDPAGVGGDCEGNDNVINVISTGITTIDPTALVGQTLPKVVGVLRPVNIGSFNVWIIFPRSADDVELP